MWLTGPFAPRHVGSSRTRARTRVPCIGRQILNHCATREAPSFILYTGLAKKFVQVLRKIIRKNPNELVGQSNILIMGCKWKKLHRFPGLHCERDQISSPFLFLPRGERWPRTPGLRGPTCCCLEQFGGCFLRPALSPQEQGS